MVSIIIPNYNHLSFIQERLDSVFNQTYQDFEVILLDDKSSDGSDEILLEYSNHLKVSHCIINKENSGSPFKQWEKGIELASGEYVWIAESDDFSESNFLEKCVGELEKAKSDLVFTGIRILNHDYCTTRVPLKAGVYSGEDLIKNHFLKNNLIINTNALVVKKELWQKVSFEDAMHFKIAGDWLLYIMMLRNSSCSFIENQLAYYRRHQSASTAGLAANELFYIEANKVLRYTRNQYELSLKTKLKIGMSWMNRIVYSGLPSKSKKKVLGVFFTPSERILITAYSSYLRLFETK